MEKKGYAWLFVASFAAIFLSVLCFLSAGGSYLHSEETKRTSTEVTRQQDAISVLRDTQNFSNALLMGASLFFVGILFAGLRNLALNSQATALALDALLRHQKSSTLQQSPQLQPNAYPEADQTIDA